MGARGLSWVSLLAEQLASQITSEPSVIERDLAMQVDPGRYVLRAVKLMMEGGETFVE